MDSNLTPRYESAAAARDVRQAAKAIGRVQTGAQVRIAAIDSDTDVALTALEDITTVTGAAMGHVVRVTRLQQDLEALAPAAASRLAFLADDHTYGMAEVVADHRRALRRR